MTLLFVLLFFALVFGGFGHQYTVNGAYPYRRYSYGITPLLIVVVVLLFYFKVI